VKLGELNELCHLVAQASRRVLPVDRPVIGNAVFSMNRASTAAPFSRIAALMNYLQPKMLAGLRRSLLSEGILVPNAVLHALAACGIVTTREVAAKMLFKVRSWTVQRKRALRSRELVEIFRLTPD